VASLCLVLDEWLLNDLHGNNGRQRQVDASDLLDSIRQKCDRIVVASGSPWAAKAYELMKRSEPILRALSRQLRALLVNVHKCVKLDEADLGVLDEDLRQRVPPDDQYLVLTALVARADVIVTTDTKLITMVGPVRGIRIIGRTEFLEQYLGRLVSE